jgi:hypothetical protein
MFKQLPHAIKSFKSQEHITISMIKAEVEAAFNNASNKKNPAWLIQWVIDHKLVCNIIFNLLFQALTYQIESQIVFLFCSIGKQTRGRHFFTFFLKVLIVLQAAGMNDTLDLIYKIIIQKKQSYLYNIIS